MSEEIVYVLIAQRKIVEDDETRYNAIWGERGSSTNIRSWYYSQAVVADWTDFELERFPAWKSPITDWRELPLASPIPTLPCAQCDNRVWGTDYLCHECRA